MANFKAGCRPIVVRHFIPKSAKNSWNKIKKGKSKSFAQEILMLYALAYTLSNDLATLLYGYCGRFLPL
jgi:hypothetical protein